MRAEPVIVGWDAQALRWDSPAAAITVVGLTVATAALRTRLDPLVRTIAVAEGIAEDAPQRLQEPWSSFCWAFFPLFFFVAFAGGLSRVEDVPGFEYGPGYTGFQFVFVLLQSAAFGGVFTGFGIARDFESGFSRRLLLAALPNRAGIVLGYATAALIRWLLTAAMLTTVALVAGMEVGGNGIDLFGLRARAHREPGRWSSGPAGSRCGSARCRPGPSCRSRSS